MLFRFFGSLFIACFVWIQLSTAAEGPAAEQLANEPLEIGDSLPQFQLSDFQGKSHDTVSVKNRPVVVLFFGVECPLVRLYAPRINTLRKEFVDQDIVWLGVNSNRHDSLKEIEHFAKATGLQIPLLKDAGNRVADLFGASRTPEVFVFDSSHCLQYHGAIDDQYSYGQQRPKVEHRYLGDALRALEQNEKPSTSETEPVGCIIGRILEPQDSTAVTYSNQISRILQERCQSCHRPGEIGPFSMTDYDEVVGWAEMIREVTKQRRMPPWHANPEHGHFKNDASLTDTELDFIDQWVKAGAPEGDPADLPEPKKFVQGWRIGQPDAVIPMAAKPYSVPATGIVPYQYFEVDPGFDEDKWIQAAECRIGNRAVVHHIIVAVQRGDRKRVHGELSSEWITATAPGAPPLILPEGFAKPIPAGSKLVFQMHYTPNGTAQSDLSSVGFKFADPATVKKAVATREASHREFRIPPHAPNYKVTAGYPFSQDTLLLSLFPHMHLRGKSFRYIANYPNGTSEILLDVPNYDFNWQNGYELAEHKLMPAGTRLTCIAHFDNSANNFANPNPNRTVGWGDQTWDEMMIGYFDMALADQDLTLSSKRSRTENVLLKLAENDLLITDELKDVASQALKSQEAMKMFGRLLRQSFPQIDRVCWTTVDNAKLTVQRVTQVESYSESCQSIGVSAPLVDCALARVIASKQARGFDDLARKTETDLKFMSKAAQSSFHIPVERDRVRGTINFWSSENHAFPAEIREPLESLVRAAFQTL